MSEIKSIEEQLRKMYGPQYFMRECPNGWFEVGYRKPKLANDQGGGLCIAGRAKSYQQALDKILAKQAAARAAQPKPQQAISFGKRRRRKV